MPEDSKKQPSPPKAEKPEAPKVKKEKVDEQEIGDFILRNVLEKDSVFFEG